jgi:hypothetical protein
MIIEVELPTEEVSLIVACPSDQIVGERSLVVSSLAMVNEKTQDLM